MEHRGGRGPSRGVRARGGGAERRGGALEGRRHDRGAAGRPARDQPRRHAALATAGTGDVLSGLIGALLAKRHGRRSRRLAGGPAHGWPPEHAAEHLGPDHVMAGDVIEGLPRGLTLRGTDIDQGAVLPWTPYTRGPDREQLSDRLNPDPLGKAKRPFRCVVLGAERISEIMDRAPRPWGPRPQWRTSWRRCASTSCRARRWSTGRSLVGIATEADLVLPDDQATSASALRDRPEAPCPRVAPLLRGSPAPGVWPPMPRTHDLGPGHRPARTRA